MKRTKTSTLNGRDLQQLPFDLMITYRPVGYVKFDNMEKEVKYITSGIEYDYLYYTWERDRQTNHYHTHILIKTTMDKEQMNQCIYKRLQGDKNTNNIRTGVRDVLVKKEKILLNPRLQERVITMVDSKMKIEYTEMYGRMGKVEIEEVIENKGVSYYTTKSTSRGLTMGYLQVGMK
jgi:6-pyruvoyl-tetrahydropterin synthase